MVKRVIKYFMLCLFLMGCFSLTNLEASSPLAKESPASVYPHSHDADELKLRSKAAPEDGRFSTWHLIGPVLGLLVLLIIVNLLVPTSGVAKRSLLAKALFGQRADNLFFAVKVKPVPKKDLQASEEADEAGYNVYIRNINRAGATIVSKFHFKKGQIVSVDLASLPGYPEGQHQVKARIISEHASGSGWHESRLGFEEFLDEEKPVLIDYIDSVQHPS